MAARVRPGSVVAPRGPSTRGSQGRLGAGRSNGGGGGGGPASAEEEDSRPRRRGEVPVGDEAIEQHIVRGTSRRRRPSSLVAFSLVAGAGAQVLRCFARGCCACPVLLDPDMASNGVFFPPRWNRTLRRSGSKGVTSDTSVIGPVVSPLAPLPNSEEQLERRVQHRERCIRIMKASALYCGWTGNHDDRPVTPDPRRQPEEVSKRAWDRNVRE